MCGDTGKTSRKVEGTRRKAGERNAMCKEDSMEKEREKRKKKVRERERVNTERRKVY